MLHEAQLQSELLLYRATAAPKTWAPDAFFPPPFCLSKQRMPSFPAQSLIAKRELCVARRNLCRE